MIEIQIHEKANNSWNDRLLNFEIDSIYYTVKHANFIIHKGWNPKFITFLNNAVKIINQI